MKKPKVSIVIPTFNEEKVIGKCLDSLINQTFESFEIIVVDDGSTDKTLDALSKCQISGIKYQVLSQIHKGPGEARNLGATKAKGNILVFVDADMTFKDNFLEKLTSPILKGKTKGTYSREEYVSNWGNLWARCWNTNEGWGKKKRHKSSNRKLSQKIYDYLAYAITQQNYSLDNYKIRTSEQLSVFRAILKSEFDKVNGFDGGGHYTDDYGLSVKLGYVPKIVREAIFYHENPDNLREIFKQARWVSKRRYKWGMIGNLYALIRSSLPVSLIVGILRSITHLQPAFVVFKLVYDFGSFVGIMEHIFSKRIAK